MFWEKQKVQSSACMLQMWAVRKCYAVSLFHVWFTCHFWPASTKSPVNFDRSSSASCPGMGYYYGNRNNCTLLCGDWACLRFITGRGKAALSGSQTLRWGCLRYPFLTLPLFADKIMKLTGMCKRCGPWLVLESCWMLHLLAVLKWPTQHDRRSAFCSAAISTCSLPAVLAQFKPLPQPAVEGAVLKVISDELPGRCKL